MAITFTAPSKGDDITSKGPDDPNSRNWERINANFERIFRALRSLVVTIQSHLVSLVTEVTGTLPIANGGTNSVTALSGSSIMVSDGTHVIQGAAGTATTVLHGNVAGLPTYSAVALAADVSGDLPLANLAQGSALSVLGVTGNAIADEASIVAASDFQVLRRSGTAVGFGSVNLASANAVTGALPTANIATIASGLTGILPVPNGGTGLATITANRVPYGNGTSAFQSSANLAFDGTQLTATQLLLGNTTGPTACLNVASLAGGAQGGDWIAWFRRESTANPCESLIRHQHFSGGAIIPLPIFTGISARGTIASPTKVLAEDYLLVVDGRGYDGSATNWAEYALGFSDTAAQMAFKVKSDWSATNHEAYIDFKTTPSGSTTPVRRLRIASTGFIGHLGYADNPFASFVAAADQDYSMILDSFNSISGSTSAGLTARRARGSQASATAALNGDTLFSFQARGYGATGYLGNAAAALNFLAAENFSDTVSGGQIIFQVTPKGSVTAANVVTIDSPGSISSLTQPRAGVFNSTTQSINDNTATALTFDSEDFDTQALHSTASATSKLTIPTDGGGVYFVSGQASFAANAIGQRSAIIKKNGTTELCYSNFQNAGVGIAPVIQVHQIVTLAAADYIELFGYQNSGGALNTGSATKQIGNQLQICKLW